MARRRYDLVIVGMGSGGMSAADFAASLGLTVAVVERGRVGGDCLWTGCVPSKALLASAKVAHHLRTADRWGLPAVADPEIDTALVWKRIREVQDGIAAGDDSPEAFEARGIEIVRGDARVVGPHTVEVGDRRLETSFVLLCTGSRPAVPDIAGLQAAGYLTSEVLFEQERAPRSVVFIGGGPISIELAQALRRLGTLVTVLQRTAGILPRDEPELVQLLSRRLEAEGVDIQCSVDVERVEVESGGVKVVHGRRSGAPTTWAAEEIFVGTGRRPNVEGLGLEELGIGVGDRGVAVDDRLRTSVPSIYAAGDVAGRFLFTHAAGYEAVRAVRDMAFPGRGTADAAIPWCTFTDPELAHTGMTIEEAVAAHGDDAVRVWRRDLSHNDRALADGTSEGRIVLVTAAGQLVGAHVLAPSAGELVHELHLAVTRGMRLSELGGLVHVYPTLATAIGQLGAEALFDEVGRWRWIARATAALARRRG